MPKKKSKTGITQSDLPGWYKVQSQTERGKYYDVNTHIGVYTCSQGHDGLPCSHQAAVVFNCGEEYCNCVATISASSRFKIARLALGEGAVQDLAFYLSIHQKDLQHRYGAEKTMYTTTAEKCSNATEDNELNFEGSEWDFIRADAWKEDSEIEDNQKSEIKSELCKGIDVMAEKLKEIVQFDDPQITTGVSKFLRRFNKLSIPRSHSKLATALHQFGWELGHTTTTQAGQIRFGKRIAVQPTAAGQRKQERLRETERKLLAVYLNA